MSNSIYQQLQERLDMYSVGFPASQTGIELKILEKLFSEEDARLFLALSPNLEHPETVAPRVGLPVETAAEHLENMSRRGLLFRVDKGGVVRYGAIPFVHGVFEFQVKTIDADLAQMVEAYFNEAFYDNMQKSAEYFLRTIPVSRSVDMTRNVASYEDAVGILSGRTDIVVTDCICRKQKKAIGRGCDKPLEACFMFGSMGQYYLDRNMGRKIDDKEAMAIVAKCQEAGLVTQPATAQNPGGMCNCCGDCCGVLAALNKHPRPAEAVFSNHFAKVEPEACSGCETCLDRCQMTAIFMNDEGLAEVNPDRCIGCGLCVITCPTEALKLYAKPEGDRREPPLSTRDQMIQMARKRGLL